MTKPSERNMKEAEELVLGVVNALGEVYPYSLKFKLDAENAIATALQARDDEAAKLVEALKTCHPYVEEAQRKASYEVKPFTEAKAAIAAWEQRK